MALGVMSMGVVGFTILALITAPIWSIVLMFNLPLIGIIAALFMYTKVSFLYVILTTDFKSFRQALLAFCHERIYIMVQRR